jgi:hypothetical protein
MGNSRAVGLPEAMAHRVADRQEIGRIQALDQAILAVVAFYDGTEIRVL